MELDPDIQINVEFAKEIRESKGWCPFQRKRDDGTTYCHVLRPYLEKGAHRYCPYLSKETIVVIEKDHVGSVILSEYFKSSFMPTPTGKI